MIETILLTGAGNLSFALTKKLSERYLVLNPNKLELDVSNVESVENSLVWISQIIGPGRGLELLFEALSFVKQLISVHLIGENKLPFEIIKDIPKNVKIVFHDSILPTKIPQYLTQFDLGIAFEDQLPISRDFTITNKVFHYFNSGIGILATCTNGQNEIKKLVPEAVELVERNPKQIALLIDQLLSDRSRIKKMKKASLTAGKTLFNYTNELNKLTTLIENVISN